MRYALNLPSKLKSDAEQLAAHQGVSLKQFIHLDADTSGLPDSPPWRDYSGRASRANPSLTPQIILLLRSSTYSGRNG